MAYYDTELKQELIPASLTYLVLNLACSLHAKREVHLPMMDLMDSVFNVVQVWFLSLSPPPPPLSLIAGFLARSLISTNSFGKPVFL